MTNEWRSVPFTKSFETHASGLTGRLSSLYFEHPDVVFESGSAGSWDEYGVRDPALLIDSRGHLIYENGALVMYYTGSCREGYLQASGRAVSHDEGLTWRRDPASPVLAPCEGSWDSSIASTPWVIRDDDGLYRLYYRGARVMYEDAVGLAVSEDGITFQRVGTGPILTPDDFPDMPADGMKLMGVMNAIRIIGQQYLLTFEATSASCGHTTQIFGAVSDDGEHFNPLNGGYPLFSTRHVRSWPVRRVANPRFMYFEDHGLYVLMFNGCGDSGLYALGMAFSRDLETWWEHPDNPLLSPTGVPRDHPFSGRLEGGVLVKEDIEQAKETVRMYLMAIPRQGPGHKRGVIGLARGRIDENRHPRSFGAVAAQPDDIRLIPARENHPETLCIHQSAPGLFPSRVFFSTFEGGAIRHISVEIFLEPAEQGSALFVLGEDMTSILFSEGLPVKFMHGTIYVLYTGYCKRWPRKLYDRFQTWWPWFWGWRKIGMYRQGVWHTLNIEKEKGRWVFTLNDVMLKSIRETAFSYSDLYNITVQCDKQRLQIRALKVRLHLKDANDGCSHAC